MPCTATGAAAGAQCLACQTLDVTRVHTCEEAEGQRGIIQVKAWPGGKPPSKKKYLKDVKEKLVSERDNLFDVLAACPFLEPYPSAANFILCRVGDGRDALEVKDALAKEGICVRHYTKPASISGCVRVSVGRPDQTASLEKALAKI